MFYVYILKSEVDSRFYKGLTSNLERRIKEHNFEKNKSTKAYLPWRLAYFEEFDNRIDARKREKYFKSGQGRDYIKINF